MLRFVFTTVAICVLVTSISACKRDDEPQIHSARFYSLGTLVEVEIQGAPDEAIDTAIRSVQTDLNYMHFAWHAWKPGPIGRTNQLLETGGWFSANPSVLPIIKKARALSIQSEGLFNPAIGKLLRLWGFQADEPPSAPPEKKAITMLLKAHPSMADIEINGVRMRSNNSAVQLDLGAMGKGFALDQIVAHLKELGIKNAIVNAGGDLRAFGQAGNRPWRIGIRHPRQAGVIASLEIQGDESVFTSGDYERVFEYQGKRYHHILDPRTGWPASKTQSVTVLHKEAAVADAAATALFVAGPEEWPRIAEKMGISAVMLIDRDGKVFISPAMQKRIKFELPSVQPQVVPLP